MENNKEKSFLVDTTDQHKQGEGVEILSAKMPKKTNDDQNIAKKFQEHKKTGFIKKIFSNESHWFWGLLTIAFIIYCIWESLKYGNEWWR
ncbi:hypothetical protein KKF60_00175 [Patescibacteria group bacterium]|nr:hypothetical protein [Patescibacteria group bacterium]MBU4458314.1 hypothetical protein [Patescibacteria group bacterium]MCG2695931.1 hypothetical protein [Candidatus Portnoybacteria bacterium]